MGFFVIFYVCGYITISYQVTLVIFQLAKEDYFIRYTHNWWHVALCYLEGHAPIKKIEEIYDERIWKELERSDATAPEVYDYTFFSQNTSFHRTAIYALSNLILYIQVYLNAAGLLLHLYVRGAHDILKDRLNELANCVTDQVSFQFAIPLLFHIM